MSIRSNLPMHSRWFHACDAPKSDTTPFKPSPPPAPADGPKTAKVPTNWAPFSAKDSSAIETIWQTLQKLKSSSGEGKGHDVDLNLGNLKINTRVAVNEDQLFEVDVAKKEIYPVYWYGPTYDIRRGTWFMSADGVKFMPCDDNCILKMATCTASSLDTNEADSEIRKFKPWKADQPLSSVTTHISSADPSPNTDQPPATPAPDQTPAKAAEAKAVAINKPELRWALFGPWMNSFVLFTGSSGGWLFSDQLTSKWTRALYSGLTRGENQGGTRVVRGWVEVEKLKKGNTAKAKRKSVPDKNAVPGSNEGSAPVAMTPEQLQEKNEAEDYNNEGEENERQINHLVLVIHGIGQKLGERLETVNFVHDCAVLRHAIKDGARNVVIPASSKEAQKPGNRKPTLPMPELGGVQVLPVQWRQGINFGRRKRDPVLENEDSDMVDIDEITLDGVPSIRMLVSDVALDVLLYMTPKYRQEMVRHVTEEMNRIYRTFMQRNPAFNGKISIYGHSLGSLLAFDILCNQPYDLDEPPPPAASVPIPNAKSSPRSLRMKGMSEVDLSDMLRGALSSGSKDSRKVKGLLEPVEIKYDKLDFSVDKLFAVGSPVGLFLLLKGDRLRARRPDTGYFEPGFSRPALNGLYNIFHPHDPIAYRFEPLVGKSFAAKRPVQIQYNKGGLTRTIVGIGEISSNIVDQGKSLFSGIYSSVFGSASSTTTSTPATPITATSSSSKGSSNDLTPAILASSFPSLSTTGPSNSMPGTSSTLGIPLPTSNVEKSPKSAATTTTDKGSTAVRPKTSNDSLGQSDSASESTAQAATVISSSTPNLANIAADEEEVKRLNPGGRIDYVLQEGVLENAYLSSLSSHMTYWPDQDIAVFILKELYSSHPAIPSTSSSSSNASAKDAVGLLGTSPSKK
ncbi:hypothetical protein HDU97_003132 [Phlyctochytrium planicorne]|nr:hypothetical protein HDU97_003083 [Phlyctochytrium planicorne]KAJ3109702.1 hypothetical protein HDU97_003132 [Phlyctochytrium planicorne]